MLMCIDWVQILTSVIPGVLAGFLTFIATRYVNILHTRKDQTLLAIATINELIEEIKTGLNVMNGECVGKMPNKSYFGMKTISDESFVRILKSCENICTCRDLDCFKHEEIRSHLKNYFEHMVNNWNNKKDEQPKSPDINPLEYSKTMTLAHYPNYPEAAKKVLNTLNLIKNKLEDNYNSILPK